MADQVAGLQRDQHSVRLVDDLVERHSTRVLRRFETGEDDTTRLVRLVLFAPHRSANTSPRQVAKGGPQCDAVLVILPSAW